MFWGLFMCAAPTNVCKCKLMLCTLQKSPSDCAITQLVMLPVKLMTVLETKSKIPSCAAQYLPETDDIAVVTVHDRTAELALMDNDTSTCLQAFDHDSQFLSLVAYIYVPSCMSNMHVMLHIFGLACTDQSITVYHRLSTAEHYGIQFQECIRVMAGNIYDQRAQCKFVCQNVWSVSAIVKVGILIVKTTWKMTEPARICGINVANYSL